MSEYIKLAEAFKKLDAAKMLRQSVYIYGATCYGKTELIKQYFKNQNYIYIPCGYDSCDLSLVPEDCSETVVIDNVNAIESEELRTNILSLLSRNKIWIIIAGRSKMPSWLFESFIKRNMQFISEEDLAPTVEGIDKFFRSQGIILTREELVAHRKNSEGNFLGIKYTAQSFLRVRK